MSTVVECLIRGGLAPRRLRDGLRRVTAPLGAAAAASFGVTARVGARIPPSILGAELADAMGSALRKALRFWDESPMDDAVQALAVERRDGALAEPSETNGTRSGSRRLPINGERTPRRGFAARAPTSSTERSALPPLTSVGRPRAMPNEAGGKAERPARGSGPAFAPLGREPRDQRETSQSPPASVRRSSNARAPSPLVAALHAYWSAEQRENPRPTSAARTEAGKDAAHTGRENRTRASALARAHPDGSWPIAAARELDRARSLPIEPAPDVASAPAARWPPSAVRPSAALELPPSPLSPQPVPEWLQGDLADQLADILREQAIDHGVNLT